MTAVRRGRPPKSPRRSRRSRRPPCPPARFPWSRAGTLAALGAALATACLVRLPALAPAVLGAGHAAALTAPAAPSTTSTTSAAARAPGALVAGAPPGRAAANAATPRPTPGPVPSRSPVPGPALSSPTRTDEGLDLRLDDVSPAVATPGEPVTVFLTLTNTSEQRVSVVEVRATLQSATPISRSVLHSWPTGAHLARTIDLGSTSIAVDLPPGDATSVALELPGDRLGPVDATTWGPRGLSLAASGRAATGTDDDVPLDTGNTGGNGSTGGAGGDGGDAPAPAGSLRTWLVLDAPEGVAPVPYTVVVPVVADADRLAGAVGLGTEADTDPGTEPPTGLSPALVPDAAELLGALDVPGAVAAVDPAVLAPDLDGSGAPVLDAEGRPTSAVLDAARALGDPDRDLVLLPLADPDLAALAHADRDLPLTQALEAAAATATDMALPARTDVALPVGSVVDERTLSLARQSGATAAVLPGSAATAPRAVAWTPAARVDLPAGAMPLPALVGDPGLAQVISGVLPTGPTETPTGVLGAVESRQLALAETAVIQRERPNHERPLTIYLERGQVPGPQRLATVLPALAGASWLAPQSLGDALADDPQEPARAALPAQEVARAELAESDIERVARLLTQVRDLAAADPGAVVLPAEESARLLLAAGWRADPDSREAAVARLTAELADLPEQVRIAPSSTINLLATTSELPVRVTNALPMDVAAVVRLDPPDARLSAPTAVEVTVPAHGEASARIPVEAAGSGNLAVRVLLTTPSGTPLGTPESLDIRVRADWETRGTAVAGIVLTILVASGIVRTAVRRRRGADG